MDLLDQEVCVEFVYELLEQAEGLWQKHQSRPDEGQLSFLALSACGRVFRHRDTVAIELPVQESATPVQDLLRAGVTTVQYLEQTCTEMYVGRWHLHCQRVEEGPRRLAKVMGFIDAIDAITDLLRNHDVLGESTDTAWEEFLDLADRCEHIAQKLLTIFGDWQLTLDELTSRLKSQRRIVVRTPNVPADWFSESRVRAESRAGYLPKAILAPANLHHTLEKESECGDKSTEYLKICMQALEFAGHIFALKSPSEIDDFSCLTFTTWNKCLWELGKQCDDLQYAVAGYMACEDKSVKHQIAIEILRKRLYLGYIEIALFRFVGEHVENKWAGYRDMQQAFKSAKAAVRSLGDMFLTSPRLLIVAYEHQDIQTELAALREQYCDKGWASLLSRKQLVF